MRVIVNRVWKWHFGTGIVDTASNFGKLGEAPTNPDLLDTWRSPSSTASIRSRRCTGDHADRVYQLGSAIRR